MQNKNNLLYNEKSPYLLQHANNPVNWFPWSEDAFNKAKAEDKPVFVSIGYSTCHWCHVMEKESFEDDEVAKILNDNFISIKVDREERPDIDDIYMKYCQMHNKQGGWPLTVFLTPQKQPFYAGTYFPKYDRMGMTGFISLLSHIDSLWKRDKDNVITAARNSVKHMIDYSKNDTKNNGLDQFEDKVYQQLDDLFDDIYGGFGNEPKFPAPTNLMFLIRYWYKSKDEKAKQIIIETLDHMHNGGMFDHIGYGFCRYSTDRKWLVPHFEKMLYDNALLAIIYLESYHAFKLQRHAKVAENIFEYTQRELLSPQGGFYCAQDADSEGEEGKFYVWDLDEIRDILGEADAEIYSKAYNISMGGNYEGKNIPNTIGSRINPDDIELLEKCRIKLLAHRDKRIHPFLDDKILSSWNGLMIAAYAMGGRILQNEHLIKTAENAAKFVKNEMMTGKKLMKRYRDGEAGINAFSDDYAYMIWGLLELYEATFKEIYLEHAIDLVHEAKRQFWDDKDGGLYLYGNDSEQLIIRPKPIYDGALPSANAVYLYTINKIAKITNDNDLEKMTRMILEGLSADIKAYPAGYTMMAMAKMHTNKMDSHILFVGEMPQNAKKSEMITQYHAQFRPFDSIGYIDINNKEDNNIIKDRQSYRLLDSKISAYVCTNSICLPPVNDYKNLIEQLSE